VRNIDQAMEDPDSRPRRIAYALWDKFEALPLRPRDMLRSFEQQYPDKIKVDADAIHTSGSLLRALRDDWDLLYVFAHGYTRKRGLSDLAALREQIKTAPRPLNAALEALDENLKTIAARETEDWIQLTKGTVTLRELREAGGSLGRRPIVFLNMCHSAQMNPGVADGFAAFFFECKAAAVIGTECQMPPDFAVAFAQRVFESLLKGERVGVALHEARQAFLTDEAKGNPLALAYSLYGNADARLVAPPASAPTSS
jgi:hypothetical protein